MDEPSHSADRPLDPAATEGRILEIEARAAARDEATRVRKARRAARQASSAARAARPFGYFAIGIVWLVLFVVVVAVAGFLLPFQLAMDGGLSHSHFILYFNDDAVGNTVGPILTAPVVALCLGYLLAAYGASTLAMSVLSFTFFGRSLRPENRGVKLSGTQQTNDSNGPVTVTTKAVSLIPTQQTRWSLAWSTLYFVGWFPSGASVLTGFLVGVDYLYTVVWAVWPVRGTAVWFFTAGSVILILPTVLYLRRVWPALAAKAQKRLALADPVSAE